MESNGGNKYFMTFIDDAPNDAQLDEEEVHEQGEQSISPMNDVQVSLQTFFKITKLRVHLGY